MAVNMMCRKLAQKIAINSNFVTHRFLLTFIDFFMVYNRIAAGISIAI
jgi:hypothetical protein